MRTLIVLAATALLAACATPQERAARMQAEMEQMMVIYGPACGRLGYPAQSDQWRNCVLQLSTKEEITRYANSPYYGGYGPGWHGSFWGGRRW